ncbi:MAG: enoyl-CoA hydratase/isomerase family protein [Planctomycetota bacterium]
MKSDAIQVSVRQNTGTIVLNRPDCGNELTRSMVRQLVDILDDLYLDKKVRTIIVTGAGDDFCRGTDLAESQSCGELPEAEEQYGDEAGDLRDLMVRMLEVTKPIIAAVQGAALAAGAGLVAAADIVVAERTASIGFPDARQGLVAGLAAPLVSFRVGAGHAARLLLTSNPIDATEAHRLGLFHELVDKDQVWARAMAVAEHCAAGAPEAIQLTKRLINETLGENLSTQLSAGAVMSATARTTEAAEEGIAAYLEGREPDWG